MDGALTPAQITAIIEAVTPYTMVPEPAIHFAACETVRLIASDVPGVIVECGTWRGGSAMAMLLAQRAVFGRIMRPVYLLDSFQGLPPAAERDGPLAQRWQGGELGENYDNCTARRDDVEAALISMGFAAGEYEIIAGWFDATAPALARGLGNAPIALLRLDGDWYDSTLTCLTHLEPLVPHEGVIIIDDYYWWDGCARATHDYLSRHDLPYRIRSVPEWHGAYCIKRPPRETWQTP